MKFALKYKKIMEKLSLSLIFVTVNVIVLKKLSFLQKIVLHVKEEMHGSGRGYTSKNKRQIMKTFGTKKLTFSFDIKKLLVLYGYNQVSYKRKTCSKTT